MYSLLDDQFINDIVSRAEQSRTSYGLQTEEFRELNANLETYLNDIKSIDSINQQLQDEIEKIRTNFTSSLESHLKRLPNDFQQQSQVLNDAHIERYKSKCRAKRFLTQREELKQRINFAVSNEKVQTKQLNFLQKQERLIRNEFNKLNEQVKRLIQQVENEKQKHKNAMSKVDTLQLQFEQLCVERSRTEFQIQTLKEEVQLMRKAKEFLDEECELIITTQNEANEYFLSHLSESINRIRDDFNQLNQSQMNQIENEYKQILGILEQNLISNEEINKTSSDTNSFNEHESLENEYETILEELIKLNSHHESLSEKAVALESDLHSLRNNRMKNLISKDHEFERNQIELQTLNEKLNNLVEYDRNLKFELALYRGVLENRKTWRKSQLVPNLVTSHQQEILTTPDPLQSIDDPSNENDNISYDNILSSTSTDDDKSEVQETFGQNLTQSLTIQQHQDSVDSTFPSRNDELFTNLQSNNDLPENSSILSFVSSTNSFATTSETEKSPPLTATSQFLPDLPTHEQTSFVEEGPTTSTLSQREETPSDLTELTSTDFAADSASISESQTKFNEPIVSASLEAPNTTGDIDRNVGYDYEDALISETSTFTNDLTVNATNLEEIPEITIAESNQLSSTPMMLSTLDESQNLPYTSQTSLTIQSEGDELHIPNTDLTTKEEYELNTIHVDDTKIRNDMENQALSNDSSSKPDFVDISQPPAATGILTDEQNQSSVDQFESEQLKNVSTTEPSKVAADIHQVSTVDLINEDLAATESKEQHHSSPDSSISSAVPSDVDNLLSTGAMPTIGQNQLPTESMTSTPSIPTSEINSNESTVAFNLQQSHSTTSVTTVNDDGQTPNTIIPQESIPESQTLPQPQSSRTSSASSIVMSESDRLSTSNIDRTITEHLIESKFDEKQQPLSSFETITNEQCVSSTHESESNESANAFASEITTEKQTGTLKTPTDEQQLSATVLSKQDTLEVEALEQQHISSEPSAIVPQNVLATEIISSVDSTIAFNLERPHSTICGTVEEFDQSSSKSDIDGAADNSTTSVSSVNNESETLSTIIPQESIPESQTPKQQQSSRTSSVSSIVVPESDRLSTSNIDHFVIEHDVQTMDVIENESLSTRRTVEPKFEEQQQTLSSTQSVTHEDSLAATHEPEQVESANAFATEMTRPIKESQLSVTVLSKEDTPDVETLEQRRSSCDPSTIMTQNVPATEIASLEESPVDFNIQESHSAIGSVIEESNQSATKSESDDLVDNSSTSMGAINDGDQMSNTIISQESIAENQTTKQQESSRASSVSSTVISESDRLCTSNIDHTISEHLIESKFEEQQPPLASSGAITNEEYVSSIHFSESNPSADLSLVDETANNQTESAETITEEYKLVTTVISHQPMLETDTFNNQNPSGACSISSTTVQDVAGLDIDNVTSTCTDNEFISQSMILRQHDPSVDSSYVADDSLCIQEPIERSDNQQPFLLHADGSNSMGTTLTEEAVPTFDIENKSSSETSNTIVKDETVSTGSDELLTERVQKEASAPRHFSTSSSTSSQGDHFPNYTITSLASEHQPLSSDASSSSSNAASSTQGSVVSTNNTALSEHESEKEMCSSSLISEKSSVIPNIATHTSEIMTPQDTTITDSDDNQATVSRGIIISKQLYKGDLSSDVFHDSSMADTDQTVSHESKFEMGPILSQRSGNVLEESNDSKTTTTDKSNEEAKPVEREEFICTSLSNQFEEICSIENISSININENQEYFTLTEANLLLHEDATKESTHKRSPSDVEKSNLSVISNVGTKPEYDSDPRLPMIIEDLRNIFNELSNDEGLLEISSILPSRLIDRLGYRDYVIRTLFDSLFKKYLVEAADRHARPKTLDWIEFRDILFPIITGRCTERHIRKLFNLFDINKNGYLSIQEIAELLEVLQANDTIDLAQNIINEYDKDNDGQLNVDELIEAIKQTDDINEHILLEEIEYKQLFKQTESSSCDSTTNSYEQLRQEMFLLGNIFRNVGADSVSKQLDVSNEQISVNLMNEFTNNIKMENENLQYFIELFLDRKQETNLFVNWIEFRDVFLPIVHQGIYSKNDIKRWFDIFDRNRNGTITHQQTLDLLDLLQVKNCEEILLKLSQQANLDEKNSFTYQELIRALTNTNEISIHVLSDDEEIQQRQSYDTNWFSDNFF